MRWAARYFPARPVIYVPGNHEFYGYDIDLTAELEAAAPENITVLSDDVLVLDGVRFLGSTLWTDFKLHGEGEAWLARERARRSMNDFVRIRNGGHRFRPEDSVVLHEASRTWLVRQLEQPFDGPTVVITHHLPALKSIAPRYASDPLNPAFASRLENECERLSSHGGVDVLLLHDAPAGVEFTWRRKDGSVRRRYQSEAEGLAQAVARAHPRVCFFGHHHTRLDAEIAGVRCIGLNKVAMPGNLVALDVPALGRGYEILGEWPRREQVTS
jgi:hypothetical protein